MIGRVCCGGAPLIGMVDTAVDLAHPALAGQSIELIEAPGGGAPSSPAHGTAIAALLSGRTGSAAEGLLPAARLIAVDAFEEAGNIFDPVVAKRLHDDIYSSGGSVDPEAAYEAFRGRPPEPDALLRRRGLLDDAKAA